jgi:hypothetical protein
MKNNMPDNTRELSSCRDELTQAHSQVKKYTSQSARISLISSLIQLELYMTD